MHRRPITAVLLAAALLFAGCATDDADNNPQATANDTGGDDDAQAITVGSPDFTEARVLGEIYAGALEAEGLEVTRRLGLGPRDVLMKALEEGDLDVVPEYTGNLLRFVTEEQELPDTGEATHEALAEPLEELDLVALEPSTADDKDGVVVTMETANRLDLEKVSDLGNHARDLVFGAPPECDENPACRKGLEDVYGLEFKEYKKLAAGSPLVSALKGGEVDAANIFSTDGAIPANDFVVLEDDKNIAGFQNVVPLVREDVEEDVADVLNEVSEKLTTETLAELNSRVDVEKEDPEDVAAEWLEENDLAG